MGCLVTVFPLGSFTGPSITAEGLENARNHWLREDDVFRPEFLRGIIVLDNVWPDSHSSLPKDIERLLQGWGTRWISFATGDMQNVYPGPQFALCGRLSQVSRLYKDVQRAFLCSCIKVPSEK